ncbi:MULTISPECIES: CPBP family intramembrane glutamic endopeptidase [unclassified Massilia]|uniref:CPBP family intramembrane glutamic endopeptidase n=1 Tax=unclassified Massilia TaxID=2609279 RepID=UPI00177C7625|nr:MULTISPECIES: type II CAAX endopeptidase family protein [unclassified Massilia]MBD8530318.1 CPBP family intramembrane metalloprotease [Massilia sp. CFBP 13647]MBD8673095.1 CPBP family intramembrane metalloprotease [Massilia sp. CFBP 13721]
MMTTSMSTPSPRFSERLLARPSVRAVLALLCVLIPFALAMVLTNAVPKQWRATWPLLLAAAGVVAGYAFYVRKVERRALTELSTAGAWRELGSGIGIGALLAVSCSVILLASGAWSVTGLAAPGVMLKPLPEQIMVALFEEILFRAVIFRLLEQSWGMKTALVGSTLLFVLAHMPNDGFSLLAATMTGVASLVFTFAWLVTRRLWLPVGLHFGWNYLLDAGIAVPVSGHAARGWVQVAASGPEWLTGGAYGIEASVVTLVAWSVVGVVLAVVARRRNAR